MYRQTVTQETLNIRSPIILNEEKITTNTIIMIMKVVKKIENGGVNMICSNCGWEWEPRVENPKRCPACHTILQPTEKMLEKMRKREERKQRLLTKELPKFANEKVQAAMCCARCNSKENLLQYKAEILCYGCLGQELEVK